MFKKLIQQSKKIVLVFSIVSPLFLQANLFPMSFENEKSVEINKNKLIKKEDLSILINEINKSSNDKNQKYIMIKKYLIKIKNYH